MEMNTLYHMMIDLTIVTFIVTIHMCVGWYDVWCDNVELIDIFEQTIHVCL